MFEYFYHEILRKTVISFGTLFNSISIHKKDENSNTFSVIEVPLAYGPTQKFLARLQQSPDLNKPVQMSLPRMSFEMVGISYDSTRKVTNTQSFLAKSSTGTEIVKSYMPIPYNVEFELAIMTKLNDDMLQITEQILPYFQPSYNMTVDLVDSIGEKRDIPVILSNLSMQDDYEGDYSTRRVLVYTFRFIAKTYLFGPVNTGVSKDIVKKVTIGFNAGSPTSRSSDLKYSVEPKATKNYTGGSITTLIEDITDNSEIFKVDDNSVLTKGMYFTIDNETMLIKDILDENRIKVDRSQYNTVSQNHVLGTDIFLITPEDNLSIIPGDDFGFSADVF
jgi:hypothetical protein